MIFHRYEDQYFLFQVWLIGDTIGSGFSRGKLSLKR